jgi:hypothetical protein
MRAKFWVRTIGKFGRTQRRLKMVESLREELGARFDSFCDSQWSVEVDGGMATASKGRVVSML